MSIDGWRLAFPNISKLPDIAPAIQNALMQSGSKANQFVEALGDDCRNRWTSRFASILPRPRPQLFRGDSFWARRRRLYRMSWSDNIEIAERFVTTGPIWHDGRLGIA
jgi:hypothetical protein